MDPKRDLKMSQGWNAKWTRLTLNHSNAPPPTFSNPHVLITWLGLSCGIGIITVAMRWITDQCSYREAKLVSKASTENGAAGNRTHEGKMAGGSQTRVHTVRQKCRFPGHPRKMALPGTNAEPALLAF